MVLICIPKDFLEFKTEGKKEKKMFDFQFIFTTSNGKKSKSPRWNILVSPQIIIVLCPVSSYEGLIARHLLLS